MVRLALDGDRYVAAIPTTVSGAYEVRVVASGDDLRLCCSIKPATSIGDLARQGRHDPCIVPRVIPVLEAMVRITLADALLIARARQP